MGLRLRSLSFVLLVAPALLSALAEAKPGPTAEWASAVVKPRLAPGGAASFVYRATTADALELTVSLQERPRQLAVLRTGSTAYRLVDGKPMWTLRFAAGAATTKRVVLRVSVAASTRPGTRLCFTLRQVAASGGGAQDVVPLPVCSIVQRP